MENKTSILKRLDVGIAGILLFAAFINVLLQVLTRITPGNAIPWTVEMGEILLVAIIWMGLGLGVLNNTHVRFDLVLTKLPRRQKKIFYIIGNVVFAVFLLVLAYHAIDLLAFHIRVNNRTPSLRWNRAIIRAPVLIGCLLGAVRMLIQAWFFAKDKLPLPDEKEISEISVIAKAGNVAGGKD